MKSIEKILAKEKHRLPFLTAAYKREKNAPYLEQVSHMVTGPVLFSYVWWILLDAIKRNIHTLYFLARDGYILREIANMFCQQFNLDIQCRYLYCSRASLRMPTYHFIGREAFDYLFVGGYNLTPYRLLQRVGFSEEERRILYQKCDVPVEKEHVRLTAQKLEKMRAILQNNSLYVDKLQKRSYDALSLALGYLKQEGLFDVREIAIVDSGWTGSMQRSLRQLIEKGGKKTNIVGYYFGMYAEPKEVQDGMYLTWYFNKTSNLREKINFNNNLFECMLSAPHEMTIGYEYREGKFLPIFASPLSLQMLKLIKIQQKGIISFTRAAIQEINFYEFNSKRHLELSSHLLKRLMQHPTREEVNAYANFIFSDDILDEEGSNLASSKELEVLREYTLIRRVWRKLANNSPEYKELFWPEGTAAYLGEINRRWYILNIYVWKLLKYLLN